MIFRFLSKASSGLNVLQIVENHKWKLNKKKKNETSTN